MNPNKSGKLLIYDEPLQVLPSLAQAIGLNEAIVLQQIHYWVRLNARNNRNFRDGYHWTFNDYEQWQAANFPFWSIATIKRTIRRLEDTGLVISRRLDRNRFNRTKWYRIDYKVLNGLAATHALVRNPENDEFTD